MGLKQAAGLYSGSERIERTLNDWEIAVSSVESAQHFIIKPIFTPFVEILKIVQYVAAAALH